MENTNINNEIPEEKSVAVPEVPEEETTPAEPPKAIEDPDNPLTDMSMKNLVALMRQVGEMVKIMEAQWASSKEEFKLTDSHMKQLYQYNEEHKKDMPDYLSDEDKQNWDHFNGLDNIPEEKVLEIFGEDHPIIGVMNTQTVDRIKSVTSEFFTWMSTLKEYGQINDAYLELVETQEEAQVNSLKEIMEKEEDPEKKKKMADSIDLYYNRKYLDFLADQLDDEELDSLIEAFSDKEKIGYWLNRSQDKLKQLKISTKFILEISQFEKRFLPEKYHQQNNILLLYFMQTIVYCKCGDKNDKGRNKAVCMVLILDRIVRNTTNDEVRTRVLNNIMAFEDQFIGKLGTSASAEEAIGN